MKNYFLKTFALCFFLFAAVTASFAQDYLPMEEAIDNLQAKRTESLVFISNFNGPKNMDYMKAVATKKIIENMFADFRSGKTVEEVAAIHSGQMQMNQVQSIKPLFPDSSGKYGTNWISEEIISLVEDK